MATTEELKGADCGAAALEGIRAVLRERLEEMCDCDIWIADLGARLDRHRDESEGGGERAADARIRFAAIWLLNHFTKERGKHFRRALAR